MNQVKRFRLALLTGRYQNPQIGHLSNILLASNLAYEVVVLVGSAQESGTARNPFGVNLRIEMLEDAIREEGLTNVSVGSIVDYSDENDICFEFGDMVIDRVAELTGTVPDLILFGDDGREHDPILWFNDEIREGIHFLMVPRNPDSVSGTECRKLVLDGDFDEWATKVPTGVHKHFNTMREILVGISDRQKALEKAIDESLKGISSDLLSSMSVFNRRDLMASNQTSEEPTSQLILSESANPEAFKHPNE